MNKTTLIRYLNSVMKNKSLTEIDKFIRTRNELPIYLGEVMIGLMLSDFRKIFIYKWSSSFYMF